MKKLLERLNRRFDRFRIIAARTHDFVFHGDEVSAMAILLALLTRGKWETPLPGHIGKTSTCRVDWTDQGVTFQCDGHKLHILRTRDEEACKDFQKEHEGYLYTVLDVGGKYDIKDEDVLRMDHHQADFGLTQMIGEHEIGYSSFGLAWGHLGADCIESIFSDDSDTLDPQMIGEIHEIVRNRLVAFVDGVDTGTWPFPPDRAYSYSNLISSLNPADATDAKATNEAFGAAVLVAYHNLMAVIRQAKERVTTQAFLREALHGSGTVLVLDKHVHWQTDLPSLDVEEKTLYVVFPGNTDEWMVQAVPVKAGSFENRKPLPEAWAGLRDSELAELTGVQDAIFCHPGRFIGGARSKQGAIDLANKAL